MSVQSTSPLILPVDLTDALQAALAYHRAGLCIIPLKGKLSALREWKQYQSDRPAEDQISDWGRQGLFANLAVLDFDGPLTPRGRIASAEQTKHSEVT